MVEKEIRRLKSRIRITERERNHCTGNLGVLRGTDKTNSRTYRELIEERNGLNTDLARDRARVRRLEAKGEKG